MGCCDGKISEVEVLSSILEQDTAIFDRLQQLITAIASGGGGLVGNNFVYNETPTGLVDGVNTVFTMSNAPIADKQSVYVNGVKQNPGGGNDYTIAGAVITFAVPPMVGSIVLVDYIKP